MSNFTAPVGGESKRLETDLIPTGFQLCTFYSLVDIGTQDGGLYGPKRQVRLAFEFPQHMRVFWEGDDPKPACIFSKETMSMNKDSNLRKKFVQSMHGRVLTDAEAEVFDISSLLGKHYVANISQSPDGKWANIESISKLDEKNMLMFGLTSPSIAQINPTSFFHLNDGFESENFAALTNTLRENIINSEEGKKHKLSGGKFAESKSNNSTSRSAAAPPPGASNSNGLIMIDKSATYEDFIKVGWTDELLIQEGKARKNEAVAPPTMAPPMAPPIAPPVAAPPVAPVKKLVFTDPNAQPIEEWLKNGWTEEMIISQGHASFQ